MGERAGNVGEKGFQWVGVFFGCGVGMIYAGRWGFVLSWFSNRGCDWLFLTFSPPPP